MCSLKVSKDEGEKGRVSKRERMCQCQLYRDQPLKLFFFHLHALNTRLISKHGENKILAAFTETFAGARDSFQRNESLGETALQGLL